MELPSRRLVLSPGANNFGTVQKMNLTACESLASPTGTIICMCFPECFEPKFLQPKKKKKSSFYCFGRTDCPVTWLWKDRTSLQSNQAVRIEYFQLEGTYKDHLVQLPEQFRADHKHVKGIVQMSLEHWQAGVSTVPLGSLLQCFTMLLVKKYFLVSSLNFLWCSFEPFLYILSLDTRGKRDQPLSLHFHSSGSFREQWGHLFSPNQRSPKPSVLSIVLFQPWQSCVGLYRMFHCLVGCCWRDSTSSRGVANVLVPSCFLPGFPSAWASCSNAATPAAPSGAWILPDYK